MERKKRDGTGRVREEDDKEYIKEFLKLWGGRNGEILRGKEGEEEGSLRDGGMDGEREGINDWRNKDRRLWVGNEGEWEGRREGCRRDDKDHSEESRKGW